MVKGFERRKKEKKVKQDSSLVVSRPCCVAVLRDGEDGMSVFQEPRQSSAGLCDRPISFRQEVTDELTWKMTAVAGIPSKPTYNEQIGHKCSSELLSKCKNDFFPSF